MRPCGCMTTRPKHTKQNFGVCFQVRGQHTIALNAKCVMQRLKKGVEPTTTHTTPPCTSPTTTQGGPTPLLLTACTQNTQPAPTPSFFFCCFSFQLLLSIRVQHQLWGWWVVVWSGWSGCLACGVRRCSGTVPLSFSNLTLTRAERECVLCQKIGVDLFATIVTSDQRGDQGEKWVN